MRDWERDFPFPRAKDMKALTCAIVLVDQPMTKYMTRIPSDMTKNINEMKLPRATMFGEVKTVMILPSNRACPGLIAAASDIVVSKCNGSAMAYSLGLDLGSLSQSRPLTSSDARGYCDREPKPDIGRRSQKLPNTVDNAILLVQVVVFPVP